jgi:hypothetical protein
MSWPNACVSAAHDWTAADGFKRLLGQQHHLASCKCVPRAKMPHRVPVVLQSEEVGKILKSIDGTMWMSLFDRANPDATHATIQNNTALSA